MQEINSSYSQGKTPEEIADYHGLDMPTIWTMVGEKIAFAQMAQS